MTRPVSKRTSAWTIFPVSSLCAATSVKPNAFSSHAIVRAGSVDLISG